jgi:hypothetical protein
MHLQLIDSSTPTTAASPTRVRRYAIATTRLLSALALLATGAVHIQQYYVNDYRVIPTIGTLFLLNFIGGTVLGLYLLVPSRATRGSVRWLADTVMALAGLWLAVAALIALFVSERTSLFGFMEHGYRLVIVVAIVAEASAALSLVAFLVLSWRPARSTPERVAPGVRSGRCPTVSSSPTPTRRTG